MEKPTHGLLTAEQLAARQEAHDHAMERREIAQRQAQALDAYRAPAAHRHAGHLIAVGVVCLLVAIPVMIYWSLILGFILAIVAACVIAGAAIGEE
jgi:hypothetical protein